MRRGAALPGSSTEALAWRLPDGLCPGLSSAASSPALLVGLLPWGRYLAVDCNFIMSQVPNMPLDNKRQSGAAVISPLSPENKHFPAM